MTSMDKKIQWGHASTAVANAFWGEIGLRGAESVIGAQMFGVMEQLTGRDIYALFDKGFDGTLVVAAPQPTGDGPSAWVVAPCDDGVFMQGPAYESDTLDKVEQNHYLVPKDDTAFVAWFPYGRDVAN